MFHSNETYASVVATSMLSGFRISGQCNSNSQENCDVVAGPPGALSKTQLVCLLLNRTLLGKCIRDRKESNTNIECTYIFVFRQYTRLGVCRNSVAVAPGKQFDVVFS